MNFRETNYDEKSFPICPQVYLTYMCLLLPLTNFMLWVNLICDNLILIHVGLLIKNLVSHAINWNICWEE